MVTVPSQMGVHNLSLGLPSNNTPSKLQEEEMGGERGREEGERGREGERGGGRGRGEREGGRRREGERGGGRGMEGD